ncbi:glycosyltransferase family 41 protein [Okeania sp. SIO1I7]|uniref:tetratricopeptide repeat protein n=1 Tax=Okeania sp. SIO1I7 TaxID=2607772 RepID=UPI0013F8FE5D|nr:glycosyltransferase family 41 protein [Okeania sp. SIO1I7]NET28212.1 tetratricopeptide repeat protein [Okeania sp. SIO1I7]
MDYQQFIQQLPTLYQNWGNNSLQLKSDQWPKILTPEPNINTLNLMQLLNHAVEHTETDEIYCEIGTTQGLTLIGALSTHPEKMAYAVNNFSNFDSTGELQQELLENLQLFNLESQVFFCDQDFEEFLLELRDVETENNIGVYFYNGSPDYRSVLLGLMLIKPFLAKEALVVINNANKSLVQQAYWDLMASFPEYKILSDLPNFAQINHLFGNGIQLLSFDSQRNHNYSPSTIINSRQKNVVTAISNLQKWEVESSWQLFYEEAIYLHQQQQWQLAEKKYQELLLWQPNNPLVWLQLGVLYYQTENYQKSISGISKSLEIEPSSYGYYYLGLGLEKISQIEQAIASYQQAIKLDTNFIDAYNNLGNILKTKGEFEQAETIYRQAISINPNHWGSYLNLGNLMLEQNRAEEAIANYEKALQINPQNPDIANNLNIAKAVKNNPAPTLLNWGRRLQQLGKYEAAIKEYRQYLELKQTEVQIYLFLSECYQQLDQKQAAINILQEGTKICPNSGQLHFTLIMMLLQSGKTEQAISQAEKALQNLPKDYIFKILKHLIVPIIYHTQESISFYRQRFEVELQKLIQTTNLETAESKQNAILGTSRITNFYLAYQAHNVRDSQITYGNFLHKIMGANYPEWIKPLSIPPVENKIRIGYISNYLHSYSGTLWLTGWLRYADRETFEIYCYYTGNSPDLITEKFRQYSHKFYHIPGNLPEVCQQILNDKLHILIYPEIGMDPPTMQTAALRLAPIQCTAWGHPVTTGLPTIDYFISSQLMEPENAQEHYSETLVKLPNIGVAYPKPKDIPNLTKKRAVPPFPRGVRGDRKFQLPEDGVIYFCCQAPFKYLPQYDYIFPEIALRVPQAKFVFLRGTILIPRLEKIFASKGLNSEDYCVHLKIPERSDYLMLNLLSDIFLDTFTWSGGNTSLEAIACNLPIVTCPGEFMRGRHADSFLKMLGVTDTIAKNEAEYIDIAVKLGLEPTWRNEISHRMSLRHNYLFDDRTCVKSLEDFYQQIVRASC